MGMEKRDTDRLNTKNLLDYVVVSAGGQTLDHGLGRTLDVSEGGLLMETPVAIAAGQTLLVTLGLGNEMVEVSGRVVRSAPSTGDFFATGVEFAAMDERRRDVLLRYLAAFNGAAPKN